MAANGLSTLNYSRSRLCERSIRLSRRLDARKKSITPSALFATHNIDGVITLLKHGHVVGVFLMFAILFLTGCVSNARLVRQLTKAQRANALTMEVLRGPISRPHKILKTVEGLSCLRNIHTDKTPRESEAITSAMLKAAAMNADAVINLSCERSSGMDLANNCFTSIVCSGDAVRYQ